MPDYNSRNKLNAILGMTVMEILLDDFKYESNIDPRPNPEIVMTPYRKATKRKRRKKPLNQ